MSILPQPLSRTDEISLIQAYQHLEYPSFAARLSNVVGTPIEMALELLPRAWKFRVQRCAEAGVGKALNLAISNVRGKQGMRSSDRRYKVLSMATGAIGGFFGAPALLLELPLTTTLMLSSIADIARSEGENLETLDTRLACMEVFAFGGRSNLDNATETGYYGLRVALEAPIACASAYLAGQGVMTRTPAPVLVSLITTIAERFGVVLSEKAVAEMVPIIGAAGGAFINNVFMQHFQDMARSHFTIRRLERKYSPDLVQACYERIGHQGPTFRQQGSAEKRLTNRLSNAVPVLTG
ncbi:MAG: uncharacterized protein H6R26_1320 [Proteobacteria bacterium]|nr:uncharacterized protein [Pseudomonadota bacterium]